MTKKTIWERDNIPDSRDFIVNLVTVPESKNILLALEVWDVKGVKKTANSIQSVITFTKDQFIKMCELGMRHLKSVSEKYCCDDMLSAVSIGNIYEAADNKTLFIRVKSGRNLNVPIILHECPFCGQKFY